MSLLSSVKKVVSSTKSVVSQVAKVASNPVAAIAKVIAPNVVKAITPTPAKINNTVQVLKSAVTGQGVTANTPSKIVNNVLSSLASNPYTTALPVGALKNPALVTSIGKSTVTVATSSAKAKIITAAAVPAAISIVATKPEVVGKVLTAPTAIASFASNSAGLVTDPSIANAKKVVKDNPLISAAVGVVAATAIGSGVAGLISTGLNTAAVKANTKATEGSILKTDTNQITPLLVSPNALSTASPVPLTPETQVIGKAVSTSKGKKLTKKKTIDGNKQSVRVNIFNQSRLGGRYINSYNRSY